MFCEQTETGRTGGDLSRDAVDPQHRGKEAGQAALGLDSVGGGGDGRL